MYTVHNTLTVVYVLSKHFITPFVNNNKNKKNNKKTFSKFKTHVLLKNNSITFHILIYSFCKHNCFL